MWNKEKAELLGECYYDLLMILNKGRHDPFSQTASVFPLKAFVELHKKVTVMPEETKRKIAKLMNMFDIEEFQELTNNPMPAEWYLYFDYGMMEHNKK